MNKERLQEIKDSIDFQREFLIASNMQTLCVDEEMIRTFKGNLVDYIRKLKETEEKNNQLQSNWNSLREENKALRLLLNWAEECDWGFDNFRDDDVIDWEEFEEETEDMDYIESMIFYAKKYLDKMNELEGVDND